MKSCALLGTSIGRSVKPRSMTIPGPAQSAPKKIRLSALRNTGSNQPAIARRRLVPRPGQAYPCDGQALVLGVGLLGENFTIGVRG